MGSPKKSFRPCFHSGVSCQLRYSAYFEPGTAAFSAAGWGTLWLWLSSKAHCEVLYHLHAPLPHPNQSVHCSSTRQSRHAPPTSHQQSRPPERLGTHTGAASCVKARIPDCLLYGDLKAWASDGLRPTTQSKCPINTPLLLPHLILHSGCYTRMWTSD